MALGNLLSNIGINLLGKNIPNIYNSLKSSSTAKSGTGTGITTTYPNTTNTYPTKPNIDTSTPYVEYPTWEEAYARAKSIYEPKYNSAELSENQLARDQLKSLKQGLSAKGYSNLRGGQRQVGEGNISQDQAATLEKLRNDYDSYINEYASGLYTGLSNNAAQKMNTLLADRDSKNQTALNLYQTDLSAALQKEINENNKYNKFYELIANMFPDEEY